MAAGYSGTPLWKKLGVREGLRTWRSGMPESVAAEIGIAPMLLEEPEQGLEMAHVFVTERRELAALLGQLRGLMKANGVVWVSWPKKAAKLATDIDEHVVRAECLPLGFVDVKVCAVDAVWSGLKLVIRKSER